MQREPSLPSGQSMLLGTPRRLRRRTLLCLSGCESSSRGPWDFAVSRDFLRARLLGLGAGELFDSISDALAAKSTSTLHTRAGPILRYVAFCESEGLEPFPVREEVVYKFFYDMQAQVAATFFKSVLSSFAFCRFVLGLDSAVLALDSLRVKGPCQEALSGHKEAAAAAPASCQGRHQA